MKSNHLAGLRQGVTLVELLIGMVIAGLILQGVVGFFIGQSRVIGENESQRGARDAARSAMHVFLADLRRVEATGGVASASPTEVVIRVPVAMGVLCSSTVLGTTISLLPPDSNSWANATLSGYAWRGWADGDYTYVSPLVASAGSTSSCTNAGIKIFSDGGVRTLSPTLGAGMQVGTPIFLYQTVRYAFEPAGAGARLVRTLPGQPDEVLVESFHRSSTRFRFYTDATAAAQDAPPADLGEIRGLEIVIAGLGDRPRPSGSVATAPITLSVFFKNRPES